MNKTLETPLYNPAGETVGALNWENYFPEAIKPSSVYQVMQAYQTHERQGTASTKTRGEVRGGGKKPWKQKGLGRARAGSIRSPLWAGGGVIFGPKPRPYAPSLSRNMKRHALQAILLDRAKNGRVKVLTELAASEPKTKTFLTFLKKAQVDLNEGPVLCLTEARDKNLMLASRNVPALSLQTAKDVNALEVAKHRTLILTQGALEILKKRTAHE